MDHGSNDEWLTSDHNCNLTDFTIRFLNGALILEVLPLCGSLVALSIMCKLPVPVSLFDFLSKCPMSLEAGSSEFLSSNNNTVMISCRNLNLSL
jgi:hypothetical protein